MTTRLAGDGRDTMVTEHSSRKYQLIDAVLATTVGGVTGAAYGGIIGMVMAPLRRAQYARDCSALGAAGFGIKSIMTEIRGKDDLTNHIVSGSGAGLALSFVKQGVKAQPAHALFTAAGFAVLTGTVYKVNETITSRNAREALYTETRAMLSKLGLQKYEKNFKKGHLTDPTLPLLTDRELQEMNIPPGARLLILDHIKRYNKMVNRK
ncbi:unnamed protein product [Eruca vesicaria subsp. sativa]|uniref:SAM domain-containing protein n=1 Tax=Eruca vesicaria subsp. sativa TaxID=29727 RepID=A0ABC8KQX4_ERUVS|nr:unnamed protein product [Eruca vesicaria subsp. sativa]